MTRPTDSLTVEYLQPQDSVLAKMLARTEIPGKEGIPVPYQLRTDDSITGVVLLCFFILTYVLSNGKHFLLQQLKGFFSIRERSNLFAEETNVDFRFRLLLVVNTCLVAGLLLFEHIGNYASPQLHAHPVRWLGIYAGISLAYYAAKYLSYTFINWIFFDKAKCKIWLDSFFLVFAVEGLLLFPLLLLVVYFDLSVENKLLFVGIIFLLGKIMLLCKSAGIFFVKFHRAFYLIVYFCALEIVPCFLLGRTLITISSLL